MIVLPYWCRTVRIYTIFRAQEMYFKFKVKPKAGWFDWIKESHMFKRSAVTLIVLTLTSIGLFIAFIVH